VHKVVRAEIGGLKIFEIGEKYYFEDIGLRNAIVGFDGTTAQREFGNLLKIEDNYPKYVVTLCDVSTGISKEGIIHVNLIDFLIANQDQK
jgi:hypothetical protein